MIPGQRTLILIAILAILVIAGIGFFVLGLKPLPSSGDNVDAVHYYNQAVDLAEQGKYAEALKYADKALSINRNIIPAWVQKADALNHLGRYEEAITATDSAIALKPNSSEALAVRADALNNLGRYQEALAASTRALQIDPHLIIAQESYTYAKAMLATVVNGTGSRTLQNATGTA
jgi:tetratricopeptide (TPR) repeat protein